MSSAGFWRFPRPRILPLAIALVDIDKFKAINDTYGHQAGDDVIVKVAGILMEEAGKEAVVGTDRRR